MRDLDYKRLIRSQPVLTSWLKRQDEGPLSSNVPAQNLPYQRWYRFKEAFSPGFVATLIHSLGYPPRYVCDPFAGSGTTALTCRFLGVNSLSVEVNPFLADLVRAKTVSCRPELVRLAANRVIHKARRANFSRAKFPAEAPPTLIEPGLNGRWIFDKAVARKIYAYRRAIGLESGADVQRLLRIALASTLVPCSNVTISGKGRRYRSGWDERRANPESIDALFKAAARDIVEDLSRYPFAFASHEVREGDSRKELERIDFPCDLFLFSPPYLNSFDYTDIYNVELWALGYLNCRDDNRRLREATLRSHVQIKRDYGNEIVRSPTLARILRRLERKRDELWSIYLPDMVTAYFVDLLTILCTARSKLSDRGRIAMVVGNSSYYGINVDVATVLIECAAELRLKLAHSKTIRSMRVSAQQGGRVALAETLLIFRNRTRSL